MINSILKILETGLNLWNNHEKSKYMDELAKLKKEYRNEMSKPEADRDDGVLDNIEFRVRVLGDSFATAAQGPNA